MAAWACIITVLVWSANVDDHAPVAFQLISDPDGVYALDVAGLNLSKVPILKLTQEKLAAVFTVHVVSERNDLPAVIGEYSFEETFLRFTPQFRFSPGVRYRAVFDPRDLSIQAKDVRTVEFSIPARKPASPTTVERVYPSATELPENVLRFYIHFSAPMRQGEALKHIQLLDENDKPIDQAFLELEFELWDREGKRLTLFLNPGRIKKGLQPREELGPVLSAGRRYTLAIDETWQDANGVKLKTAHRKAFRAKAAEEQALDAKKWKLTPPGAQTREALAIRFPNALDFPLLHRFIWVEDANGQKVVGKIQVGENESAWRFVPDNAWQNGDYRVVADTRLEDRAGNSLDRPFEVDAVGPIEADSQTSTVAVPFRIPDRSQIVDVPN